MPPKRIKKAREARGLPAEGFARLRQVLDAVPVSETAWYRGIAAGKFPRPIKLGPRTAAWRVEDIRDVIDAMTTEAE